MQKPYDRLIENGKWTMSPLEAIRRRRLASCLIEAYPGNWLSKKVLNIYCSRYFLALLLLFVAVILEYFLIMEVFPQDLLQNILGTVMSIVGVVDVILLSLVLLVLKDIREVDLAFRHIIGGSKKTAVEVSSLPKTPEEFAKFVDDLLIHLQTQIVFYNWKREPTKWRGALSDFDKILGAAKVLGVLPRTQTSMTYRLRVQDKWPLSTRVREIEC